MLRSRRGVSAILIVVVLAVLIFFVSLAVDFGRVWLARAEMQTVADAAARAGALSLPQSNQQVWDDASEAAISNPVLDTEKDDPQHLGQRTNPGVDLDTDEDIIFGIWRDNPAAGEDNFIELEDLGSTPKRDERRSANAVMAWGRRIEDRDNPLPLIFGPVLGIFHSDVERKAVAAISGGPSNFGFVGIDSVSSNGNKATVQSMTQGKSGKGGGVASDGDINLGNGDVYGDARPGIGKSIIQAPNSEITGWTANLDYSLKAKYPAKKTSDIPGSATVVTLPGNNKDWTLPPGNPSNDPNNPRILRLNGNLQKIKTLTINGYVNLYVVGSVDLKGNAVHNAGNIPAKLNIIVIGAGTTVDVGGNATQYAHIYAPESTVKIHGTPGYYGRLIGKTLAYQGTADMFYDDTNADTTPYSIRLVQ